MSVRFFIRDTAAQMHDMQSFSMGVRISLCGQSPPPFSLYSMLGGYRAASCRSHRANVEARASGDFGYGPSPQGSCLRKHLGGARKPHAVALITFKSCNTACVATLSTCSSAVTSNLAQAHVRASCSAGRSLEQPAFAIFPAQPLIG